MPPVYAQTSLNPFLNLGMPLPGTMMETTPAFDPALIRGLQIFPDEPLHLNFVMETGEDALAPDVKTKEYTRMIKYFLAALTVPDDDMWVNLSPSQQEQIIPEVFGQTEMGRDLLAQDYVLKQLTASLLYPEKGIGKEFWNQVRAKVKEKYGDIDIPMETFHKVWVVPDEAEVTVQDNIAFVTKSRLKVMIEEDYLALQSNTGSPAPQAPSTPENALVGEQGNRGTGEQIKEIIREIILPEIEKEVNQGKHFATLRQVYHALILATWFKRNLQKSFLGAVYVDRDKTVGVDVADKMVKYKIYQQYMNAFKQGVFDFIKEEYDESTGEVVPRQYFSGGVKFAERIKKVYKERAGGPDAAMLTHLKNKGEVVVTDLAVSDRRQASGARDDTDAAMLTQEGTMYYVPRLFYEVVNDGEHALAPLEALSRAFVIWLQGQDEVDE
ncbi:MAG TPA: hypothetical protein VLJ10_04865, partial [Candidatus Bathyarchaeia archaeon]|nr:hypothetical protein [Candidatus Bathyarchaeia archaeon]